jgi:hypothetical protein
MNDPSPLASPSIPHLQKKIGWICNLIRWAGLIWFLWMLGVFLFVMSHRAEYFDKGLKFHEIDPASISDATFWLGNAGALLVYVPTAVVVWRLWGLMQGYLQGDILTVPATDRLRSVALAGLFATAADVILPPLTSALMLPMLLSKTPWWQMIRPTDLFYALICGFLLALSAIFRAAAEIVNDHAQIV